MRVFTATVYGAIPPLPEDLLAVFDLFGLRWTRDPDTASARFRPEYAEAGVPLVLNWQQLLYLRGPVAEGTPAITRPAA